MPWQSILPGKLQIPTVAKLADGFHDRSAEEKAFPGLSKIRREAEERVTRENFKEIEDKIDALHRRLDLIFGKEVLINGIWRKI